VKKTLIPLILLTVLLVTSVQAQWTLNALKSVNQNGMVVTFTGQLDSLATGAVYDTLVSNWFDPSDFDGVDNLDYSFLLTHVGNVKVKMELLVSNYTTTTASMAAVILQDSTKLKVETPTYKAMAGIRGKYWKVRLSTLGGTGISRDNVAFKLTFILPKRDY
jgi:hypothetical protein